MMKKEAGDRLRIELERSRLNREKGMTFLNNGMYVYFCFIFVAVIGFVNHYISKQTLDMLIILGIAAIIIGAVPYIAIFRQEDKRLRQMLCAVRGK